MSVRPQDQMRQPLLGCVADDVTGATDLAINLVQGGMAVVQVIGVPTAEDLRQLDADAIVIALKTRSTPVAQAVAESLASVEALQDIGVTRLFFKYCSTFDSTEQGNIGPVAEAMMDKLGVEHTIFCPAFPRNGRTVYQGHLFVHGRLLNESGMENHPLNPMTDPDLVRFLGKQVRRPVGLLAYEAFHGNARQELQAVVQSGTHLIVTDSCDDRHLATLAEAVTDWPLLTGGSGIARYLPDAYREVRLLESAPHEPELPDIAGRSLILSGSCSAATNQQVAWMKQRCPSWRLDVAAILADSEKAASDVLDWASRAVPDKPLLVYSTAPPDEVTKVQERYGREGAARAIEDFHAAVATHMVDKIGVRRLVLAGGETAGAVINALGVRALHIGPEICAGVPWTSSTGERPLALALKSGNFGDENFFEAALEMLP